MSLWTDSTPLIQSLQADMSKLVHSKDVLLVAKSTIISSESDMQNSMSLINILMWDVLNSDADYVKNTFMSEVSFVMK